MRVVERLSARRSTSASFSTSTRPWCRAVLCFPSSAFACALGRTQIPCLNWNNLFLPLAVPAAARRLLCSSSSLASQVEELIHTIRFRNHQQPALRHSKYIAFPRGGFLQVAYPKRPPSAPKLELSRWTPHTHFTIFMRACTSPVGVAADLGVRHA